METLTAKDFQEPLRVVLYNLTEEDGECVHYKLTYEPIMQMMGIPNLAAYGFVEEGRSQVGFWIQAAYKNLKRMGQVLDAKRGMWGLTNRKHIAPLPNPMISKETQKMAVNQNLSSPVSRGYAEDGFFPDPYIRAVAAQQTACYGHYSAQSSTCGRCPLSGSCLNFLACTLSALRDSLAKEDLQGTKPLSVEPPAPPPPEPEVKEDFDWTDWNPSPIGAKIAIAAGGTCLACNQPTVKNTPGAWLTKTSSDGKSTKSGRIFHEACVPAHVFTKKA